MKKTVFLTIFFIVLIILVPPTAAQSINTIEVHENGTALWTIQERVSLETQPKLNEWNQFISTGQGYRYQQIVEELNDRTNQSLISAENYTKRTMEIRDVNISYDMLNTTTGTFGIINFHFEWVNFSHVNSSGIFIGDAFTEVMVPSPENVLIIKIPDNYDIVSVSPEFDKDDGTRLIWDGTMYRSFNVGEPSLVLKPKTDIWPMATNFVLPNAITSTWPLYILILILLILISGISVLLLKRKRTITTENDDDVSLLEQNLTMEYLEDEEMIIKILIKHNGQAKQSDIVTETGFSKSKISNVLAKMKEDGDIEKIRKGKSNLIRLKNN
jgi:uncharacterized membrane protein